MRMSRHHTIALSLFGIAVCTGFLLSAPATAGSGQGFEALESGNLFASPFNSLSAANRSPAFSEDTPDILPEPGDTGSEIPAEPENNSQPIDSVPVVRATPETTGIYDDERLERLINTAGIGLMRLSMEHAHALCRQDAGAASIAADDLHALSLRLLGEVEPLRVSSAKEPVRGEFIRVLRDYSSASEALLDAPIDDEGTVLTALGNLSAASSDLEAINRQALDLQPIATGAHMVSAVVTIPAVGPRTSPAPIVSPAEALPLGERYTYDDPAGENMISLLVESTRIVTVYEAFPANESTEQIEAGEGRAFLLVVVKGTNLGHKGDSDLYTIETPGKDAFTLEYQGVTFVPLNVPAYTLYGESFDRKTLERYESEKGYIYFDVPETFEATGATLRADLGDAGTPPWDLGKKPGL